MLLFFTFLIPGTIFDIRSRRIPVVLFAASGLMGAAVFAVSMLKGHADVMDELYGLMLGAVFIGLSRISGEKIGMGDALAVLLCGIYMGGYDAAFAVLTAMLLISAASLMLLMTKKGSKDTALPFMPFLLISCILQYAWVII